MQVIGLPEPDVFHCFEIMGKIRSCFTGLQYIGKGRGMKC